MVTIAALNSMLSSFYSELCLIGYRPSKMVLFGSYAKGHPHKDSDIDIAIWSPKFSGSLSHDMEFLAPAKRKFPMIEIHTFNEGENEKDNPFIGEIMRTGKVWAPNEQIVFN